MSEHVKGQIVRALRLAAALLAFQPVASAIASSTLVRYPLVAALLAGFEVAVRQGFPVKSLPRISSVLAPTASPSPLNLPTVTSDAAATVRVVAPPPLPPMPPMQVPLNPDGTGTATNPAPPAAGAQPGGEGATSP